MALSKVDPNFLNVSQVGGRRNILINGNMEVNQRSFSSNTGRTQFTYAGDRWIFAKNDVVNYDSSYNSFSVGQTDVPGAKAYHEFTLNSAGSGTDFVRLEQRIEDVTTAAGEQVTLSFWARSNTGSGFTLDADGITAGPVEIMQYFGTGGTPSSVVETDFATSITLNTTWTKYTYTATLPSVSGKTIGTDGNDHLRLIIGTMMDDDAGNGIQIAQVQLERGDTATPFEHRSYAEELSLCQRYFNNIVDYYGTNVTGLFMTAAYATDNTYTVYQYPVEMRAPPTFSYGGAYTDFKSRHGNNVTPSNITTHGYGSKRQIALGFTATATAGSAGWMESVSSDAYMYLDAEF